MKKAVRDLCRTVFSSRCRPGAGSPRRWLVELKLNHAFFKGVCIKLLTGPAAEAQVGALHRLLAHTRSRGLCPMGYSVDVECGLFDGPRSFQPVPTLMPIVTAIISAVAVALHQIKRREGSGMSGLFAFLERNITE
jgi:hypothetical protein